MGPKTTMCPISRKDVKDAVIKRADRGKCPSDRPPKEIVKEHTVHHPLATMPIATFGTKRRSSIAIIVAAEEVVADEVAVDIIGIEEIVIVRRERIAAVIESTHVKLIVFKVSSVEIRSS